MRSESESLSDEVEGAGSNRALRGAASTGRIGLRRSGKRGWLPELAAGLPFSEWYFLTHQATSLPKALGEREERRGGWTPEGHYR